MDYGIADLSIVPMRSAESERSEMVSQLLFGELIEVLRTTEKWACVKSLEDGYEGWIDRRMYKPVTTAYADAYRSTRQPLATDVFNVAAREGDYGNKLLVSGSVLPFFDPHTRKMKVGDEVYTLVSAWKERPAGDAGTLVTDYALMYCNTPYLWGGRSPFGIDCSGLSQMAYRLAGYSLPRDASQQVRVGEDLSFVEEALPGDLAFFGDESRITHVGIIWYGNRIIHASGRVRVDRLDHQGIYNGELKRYTHNLKAIKRLL